MLVKSIYEQIKEVTGKCDEGINFQAISRAIELLSNEGLFDPLIGYLEFTNSGSNLVTLPRVVKTILRVNINSQPTFFRNRLFEFTLNSPGSVTADEVSLSWSDRGYSPIQKTSTLPGILRYKCENAADIGKTVTIHGYDSADREISETILAGTTAVAGTKTFAKITSVSRDTTVGVCLLYCNGTTDIIAQYYPDETDPSYRVIRLSKAAASVRIMFRRDVYEIASQEDLIPLNSKMAVIHATKAVRYYAADEYEKGDAALARAVDFIKKEQASRDEQDAMAAALEVPTMTDSNMTVRDSIVVSDVYDVACDIFGNLGRANVLDKITTAIEVLRNKAHWDAGLGIADIWTGDRTGEVMYSGNGDGYFVLPRFVESVVSLNRCDHPAMPRNQWFEFHLNGNGTTNRASCGTWDDAGETCLSRKIPIDPALNPRRIIPVKFWAVPSLEADEGKTVTFYGIERLSDGTEIEVYRDGKPGWSTINSQGEANPGVDAPAFVRVDRIKRETTSGFVTLKGYSFVTTDALFHPQVLANIILPADFAPLFLVTVRDLVGNIVCQGDYTSAGNTPSVVRDAINSDNSMSFVHAELHDGGPDSGHLEISSLSPIHNIEVSYTVFGSPVTVSATSNPSSTDPAFDTYTFLYNFGFWYPDEVEPKYRAIRVSSDHDNRIRILYRKRFLKLTSLYEPIPLRSRLALESQMRAIKALATDPVAAQSFEALAVGYLSDERINSTPSDQGSLQFDSASMPGFTGNIQ